MIEAEEVEYFRLVAEGDVWAHGPTLISNNSFQGNQSAKFEDWCS